MKRKAMTLLAAVISISISAFAAESPSSYVGQEGREIKSLSADDIDDLLAGKGMGLAKAAELNGYAGPAHVLELAPALLLTPEQTGRTRALFKDMQTRAKSLGVAIVTEERKLDALFADKSATRESLGALLAEISALQGQVRAVHLEAHLAQVEILSPEQNERYVQLRGYGAGGGQTSRGAKHRH